MVWKIRWLVFRGLLEVWAKKFFSSPQVRAADHRHSVNEAAFETWLEWGAEFERILNQHIAQAERDNRPHTAHFWRDVMESAKDFDTDPENRRKRDAMTFRPDPGMAAE